MAMMQDVTTVLGVVVLAINRRKVALLLIPAVPLYYWFSHAPFHFEHRYMLPAYFFWFMLVGLALYWIGVILIRLVSKLIGGFARHEPRLAS
jgi:hypothetical protein